ncbi:MAG: hypothetical protein U9P00_02615, partial [Pseudomonadota bacterium]|nr:hypothetical protein [Pseudomonadota bacterium]
KSAKYLPINDDGYWNPKGEVIQAGDKVTLSFEKSDFSLTKPIDSHALYHIANGGRSAVTHVIEPVETGQGPIANEAVVRFKIVKPKYPGKDYLFHGAQDNLYYAEYPNDKASHWQVRMIDRGQGSKLRSGMKVQLQGIRWDKYMTLVDGDDIQWAKAVRQGAGETVWTINKDVPPEPLPK